MIQLEVEIKTKNDSIAETVVKSLFIDIITTSEFFERSNINLSSVQESIFLKITSKDITAAKASINTCLKWIENSIKIIENFKQ